MNRGAESRCLHRQSTKDWVPGCAPSSLKARVRNNNVSFNWQGYSLSYIDSEASGQLYYRLKLIDFDQSFSYSEIVSIEVEKIYDQLEVYPNPTSSYIVIDIKEKRDLSEVVILDASNGSIIKRITIEDRVQIVDMEQYASGLYIVQYRDAYGAIRKIQKLVKE